MPTPDRTSLEEIVRAGRAILEAEGPGRLTMQAVADRVGVRAPSLYKRVRSREALIGLIAEDVVTDLGSKLDAVAAANAVDSRNQLSEFAHAFRTFAHANPQGYHLIFAGSDATRPNPDLLARASTSVLHVAAAIAGPEHALEAARTITAWANGFISMELADAFRLGGDVDDAYEFGIARLAAALAVLPRDVS